MFISSASYRAWNIDNRYAVVASNVMTNAYSLAGKMNNEIRERDNPIWRTSDLHNCRIPEDDYNNMIEKLKLF